MNESSTLEGSTETNFSWNTQSSFDFEIRAPFSKLFVAVRNADPEATKLPATVLIKDAHGIQKSIPATISLRGNSSLFGCTFPKLKLDFTAQIQTGHFFETVPVIRIATHCMPRSNPMPLLNRSAAPAVAHHEQLVYRFMKLFDLPHFNTRLANIAYVDSDGPNELMGTFKAFILEDKKLAFKRMKVEPVKKPLPARTAVDPQTMADAHLFEILVNNIDFAFDDINYHKSIQDLSPDGPPPNGVEKFWHNADLFKNENNEIFPLISDYDLSGLVKQLNMLDDTVAEEETLIQQTRQLLRYFTLVHSEEAAKKSISDFSAKRSELFNMLENSVVGEEKISSIAKFFRIFFDELSKVQVSRRICSILPTSQGLQTGAMTFLFDHRPNFMESEGPIRTTPIIQYKFENSHGSTTVVEFQSSNNGQNLKGSIIHFGTQKNAVELTWDCDRWSGRDEVFNSEIVLIPNQKQ